MSVARVLRCGGAHNTPYLLINITQIKVEAFVLNKVPLFVSAINAVVIWWDKLIQDHAMPVLHRWMSTCREAGYCSAWSME